MKKKKIIVTGESGLSGKYLCHWFAKLGWKFVAILRRGGVPEVACDGFHCDNCRSRQEGDRQQNWEDGESLHRLDAITETT
ncbi:MAG: hypothetical protein ACPGJR_10710 [Akkermansiaceae bacterium]